MIPVLLLFWIFCAFLIILERKMVKMIIYLMVFSLVSSFCFILYAAPDVSMAEAVVSVFSTIIFIISFEKYYDLEGKTGERKKTLNKINQILPIIFSVLLFILFVKFIPGTNANTYLKDQYISRFSHDVGGENAVTAIYLGYRLYDTLFESLMLLVSIAAIIHLSWFNDIPVSGKVHSDIRKSQIAVVTIRIICPVLILFSIYLTVNGHLSPGGGFQGGVIAATFFICRYIIYDIYDMPIGKVLKLEKIVYAVIIIFAMVFIFLVTDIHLSKYKNIYLIAMNLLIGMKVACGFLVIFYRFIAFERH